MQIYQNQKACGISRVFGTESCVRFRRGVSVTEQGRAAVVAASWTSANIHIRACHLPKRSFRLTWTAVIGLAKTLSE
jgi:hypothetical protein